MSFRDTQPLAGFSELAPGIDLCLCDVWGVIHNGVSVFAEAVECLAAMRGQGISVVLVTNAPRPRAEIVAQLDGLGVPRAAWDLVVTSGDVCRGLIAARGDEPLFLLGPARDLPLVAGLAAPRVAPERAGYVVCTGLFDDENETMADYAALLADLRARGLTLICANPDLVVERGGRITFCAGSIALAYEEIGGTVLYAGKPHRPIYDLALAEAAALRGGPVPPDRICAIGDAIRTDVAGAEGVGMRSLMVMAGIHAQDLVEADWAARQGWFAGQPHRPDYAMPHLRW